MKKLKKWLLLFNMSGCLLFLVVPMIVMSAFIPSPETQESLDVYKSAGDALGVSWADMLLIDMVENDNDFSKITDKEILERALSFIALEVSELEEETTTTESIAYVKGKPVKIKTTQTDWVVKRTYAVRSKEVISFFTGRGRSVKTANDVTSSVSTLDSRHDLNVRINHLGFEDVVETLPDDKQEWAWEVYSSNMVLQVYGDDYALPETIATNYSGFFAWPLPGHGSISSSYGWRTHPTLGTRKFHHGIDLPAPTGTPIIAASKGTVITVSYSTGSTGYYVKLGHTDQDGKRWSTTYMHMSQISVAIGQPVEAGTVIGAVGNTGRSTGPHLHFEVKYSDNTVDPMLLMQRNRQYN